MDVEDMNRVQIDVALNRPAKNYDDAMLEYRRDVEKWYAELKKKDPKAAIDVREP